jgi:hypothetical protein
MGYIRESARRQGRREFEDTFIRARAKLSTEILRAGRVDANEAEALIDIADSFNKTRCCFGKDTIGSTALVNIVGHYRDSFDSDGMATVNA